MTIAKKIETTIRRSSWIRKMFEEGARLKARHGADNVFDFSLGNPNVPAPECFEKVLNETALRAAENTATCPIRATPTCVRPWPVMSAASRAST